MSGFVAYRGPSRIDQAPVAVVVTVDSTNRKTGPMAQSWILRTDLHPLEALHTGADVSICGSCAHRGPDRSCYVNVAHAPAAVYRALQLGKYEDLTRGPVRYLGEALQGSLLRLGAYGDPAVVPRLVWEGLLSRATAWTGYTHLWRTYGAALYTLCMASVDSAAEAAEAQTLGWRTYRCRTSVDTLAPSEIVCPASDEAGHRVTCTQCRLCMGTSRPAKSIAIMAHGSSEGAFYRQRQGVLAWE